MVAPPIPEAKKRERAQLSNLFERLSTRRKAEAPILDFSKNNNQTPPPRPEELSGVLRDLSVMRNDSHSRTRRNTVASPRENPRISSRATTSLQEKDEDDRSLDNFPLVEGEKYPFTFKHMIYKLYNQDDWIRTLKDVLEKSKKNFKPLAESGMMQNPPACIDPHGNRVKFVDGPPHRVERRTNASGTTKRKAVRRMSLADKYHVDESPAESGRALKKRCVGIRKSISGNPCSAGDDLNSETREPNKGGGTFVFASTVSSTEYSGKEIYLEFPSPQVSPSVSCFSDEGHSTTSSGSPLSPITPTSSISPYMMGCVAGLKRRVSVSYPVVVLKAPPTRGLTERNMNRLSSRFSMEDLG